MGDPNSLRHRLTERAIVVAPGVYDALTALLAVEAGFSALYVSGAAIAYTRLGRPDIGLVSMSEVAEQVTMIHDRVGADLVVDADTGYGNALNVQRTVRLFERAGARALQLEDQTFPKRCGHFSDKSVVPAAEMIGKIKAAVDARTSEDTLIIARTDAVAVEGFEAAIARAHAYADAGADVLFVEAPRTRAQLEGVVSALYGVAPLMANMVEGGQTPLTEARTLEEIGFSLVIFPGAIVRVLAKTAQGFYGALAREGASVSWADRMFSFDELNGVIGTPEMLALGRRYEGGGPGEGETP
jgi:2-methylisocitrate lyase-like PEP mutase family enzyme